MRIFATGTRAVRLALVIGRLPKIVLLAFCVSSLSASARKPHVKTAAEAQDSPATVCARVAALLCGDFMKAVHPNDKMTVIVEMMASEDAWVRDLINRTATLPREAKKHFFKSAVTKREGKSFVCPAFDIAWNGLQSECRPKSKAEAPKPCLAAVMMPPV